MKFPRSLSGVSSNGVITKRLLGSVLSCHLWVASSSAPASTLRVPGDFSTIQAAVDHAVTSDTILVAPGLYPESVQCGAKSVQLISTGGASVTHINPPSGQVGVRFGDGVNTSVLSGFTISNASAGVSITSGLASCPGCTPTITSNVIVKCGTGIGAQVSSPRIRYNVIRSCTGDAILLVGQAAAIVEHNLVQQNGVGIKTLAAGSPTIRNNVVRGNVGSGIFLSNDYLPTEGNISQNLVVNNGGYGIFFGGGTRGPWIMNNTVAGNGLAGLWQDASGPDVRVVNNVVVGNPALFVGNNVYPPKILFNNFYSHFGPAVSGVVTNVIGIDGNSSTNPFFVCEPGGDFHLLAASPLIDAGTNGAALLEAVDLDGQPRIVAGHTNGPATVDLGAFEFDPSATSTACFFFDCQTNLGVMAAPGQDSTAVYYPDLFATPGATITYSPPSGSIFPIGDSVVDVRVQFGANVTNCSFGVTVVAYSEWGVALNATNLPWVSVGDAPWFVQGDVTHDGISAVRSSGLTDLQSATLRTVLSGPGPLSFWWKSSILPGSLLSLNVDGVTVAGLAGVTDWQFKTIDLAPGPHVVDWKLACDTAQWGQPTAWLDQVSFPSRSIPIILVCPSNRVVIAGPGQYSAPVHYPAPFATPGATVLTSPASGSVFPAGDSIVNVTATYGTDTTNCSFAVSVRTALDFGLALNTTNLDWTTLGDASWYLQTNVTRDGVAIQSGAITNGQIATVQTTLQGPGVLTYWWKVSSQANSDLLFVTLNGNTQAVVSGQVDWQQHTIFLGSGNQVLQWIYAKDGSGSGGQDAAWLDQVSWTPGSFPPSITQQPVNLETIPGSTATFSLTAVGTPPLAYQWSFNGETLPGANGPTLTVSNVQVPNLGAYRVVVTNQFGSSLSSNATLTWASIVAWGANSYGQTDVPLGLYDVAAVAGGWHHSAALRTDGTVVVWGDNNKGQTNVPPGLSNVVAISSRSGDHIMALRAEGTVVVWGDNSRGQRNVPAGLSNVVAISAGGARCLALKSDGTAVSWGDSRIVPAGLTNLMAVSAGDSASLFLRSNGTVAATGTLVPPIVTNIIAIAAGGLHNLALRVNGTVIGWGDNQYGQSSIPAGLDGVVSIAAGDYHSTALRSKGTVVVWGRYKIGTALVVPAVPRGLTNVLAIAAGSHHDLALLENTTPPFIVDQPVSQTIVAGNNATFSVTAGPNDAQLSYQWRFNGTNDIPYATNSSLTVSSVQSAAAGFYTVRVTNRFGSALSSSAFLRVDYPPLADASATRSPFISANGTNAIVILDGSRSSDPEGDPLQYRWFNSGSTNVLTNGVVAVVILPVGTNSITMTVSDGLATDSQTIAVEVLAPAEAISRLIDAAGDATAKQALVATISAALRAIDRGNPTAALNQLRAFQNQVSAQLGPNDPVTAQTLIDQAQSIIDAIIGGAMPPVRIKIAIKPNGKSRLSIPGVPGQIYIIEASSDLVIWEMIGIARDQTNGDFIFDDDNARNAPTRYYRIIVP